MMWMLPIEELCVQFRSSNLALKFVAMVNMFSIFAPILKNNKIL